MTHRPSAVIHIKQTKSLKLKQRTETIQPNDRKQKQTTKWKYNRRKKL